MSKRINYGRLVLWLHSIHNDMCRWINTDGQPQPENLDPPHAGEDARASGVRMPLAHRTQMSTIEIRHSRMMQEKFSASHIAGYSNATSIVIEIIMRKSISSLTYAED